MNLLKKVIVLLIISTNIVACNTKKEEIKKLDQSSWSLTSFKKVDSVNPILQPLTNTEFLCPVRGSKVKWEGKDVFNPATIVKDGKVYMIYRAEDFIGKWK